MTIGEFTEETNVLELWTWGTPNGWKISIMLEELREFGVDLPPIEVHNVSLVDREQFSEEFSRISPNQKIPGLVDGDRTLMESCAILLYLAEKYPSPLLPQDASRWDVIQWLIWQAAGLGPTFGNKLSYTRYMEDIPAEQKSHPLDRFNAEAQRLLRVLDKQLEAQDFVCGNTFTIADIACFPWVRGWKWSKIDITGHSNVVAWVRRVRARPGVERGLAYGISKDEVDGWNEETKKRYAALGTSIASNESIASKS